MSWNVLICIHSLRWTGLSFAVDQPGYSSMPTVCTTTTHAQTCQASCKPRSSSDTWLAFATASSSCSGPLVSAHPYSLFATYTAQSSVSNKLSWWPSTPYSIPHKFGRAIWHPGLCRTVGFFKRKKLVISYCLTFENLFHLCIIYSTIVHIHLVVLVSLHLYIFTSFYINWNSHLVAYMTILLPLVFFLCLFSFLCMFQKQ